MNVPNARYFSPENFSSFMNPSLYHGTAEGDETRLDPARYSSTIFQSKEKLWSAFDFPPVRLNLEERSFSLSSGQAAPVVSATTPFFLLGQRPVATLMNHQFQGRSGFTFLGRHEATAKNPSQSYYGDFVEPIPEDSIILDSNSAWEKSDGESSPYKKTRFSDPSESTSSSIFSRSKESVIPSEFADSNPDWEESDEESSSVRKKSRFSDPSVSTSSSIISPNPQKKMERAAILDEKDISSSSSSTHSSKNESRAVKVLKRRKGTIIACIHCYKAKQKCDKNRPCGRCVRTKKTGCEDRSFVKTEKPDRPKRIREKRVCSNCLLAKSACDSSRPCGRCVRLSKDECVDRALSSKEKIKIRKKKNRGISLGRYQSWIVDMLSAIRKLGSNSLLRLILESNKLPVQEQVAQLEDLMLSAGDIFPKRVLGASAESDSEYVVGRLSSELNTIRGLKNIPLLRFILGYFGSEEWTSIEKKYHDEAVSYQLHGRMLAAGIKLDIPIEVL